MKNGNTQESEELMMMDKIVREQILEVRDTGRTNMLDTNMVQVIANEMNLYELVVYLIDDDNRKEYWDFILYGDDDSLVNDTDDEESEDC